MAPPRPRFVRYLRVSTDGQGRSGLGLEAQRQAVAAYGTQAGGEVVAEFREVENGKRADRPQLAAALASCRTRRAVLVIAKLTWDEAGNAQPTRAEFVAQRGELKVVPPGGGGFGPALQRHTSWAVDGAGEVKHAYA